MTHESIYEIVRRIPQGSVATYGQIARLAGAPGAARQVGYALAASDEKDGLPWQRVVNAKGEVSQRASSDGEVYQRILLEMEGVVFSGSGRISLDRFQWRPEFPR
ncbi:MAG: methyltransferase [Gammaproteobacteria bacterium]|nr:methyltransferase [Gammaproteobacteria bacterium]